MTVPQLRNGIFVLLLCALNGCSNLGKSYSQINPEAAAADVRKHNGYFSLKKITPGTAKLVMRSEGFPANVEFSISTSGDDLKNFQNLGIVRDSGHGVIYPWIAKLTDKASRAPVFLSKDLVPAQLVLIRSYGSSSSNAVPVSGTTVTHYRKCGPLLSGFTPEAGHAYLARFEWRGSACEQKIFDATDPDAPIPVPGETVTADETP